MNVVENPWGAVRIDLGCLQEATIVDRLNRFVALVKIGDSEFRAHIADSGRLKELVYPGNLAMVREAASHGDLFHNARVRSTSHDLVLASSGTSPDGSHRWVSVDTRYPNKVFGLALRKQAIDELAQYTGVHPEHYYDHADLRDRADNEPQEARASRARVPRSRFDFMLEGDGRPRALLEVKSVTLCIDGVGLFPDAPTTRGTRHLKELTKAVSQGYRAYAVFIAQRHDIQVVKPNRETDPDFAFALKEAYEKGVRLLGYRCVVTPREIILDPSSVPVEVE